MTRPSWLGRAVRNRHRHAIEQASRRWRGGRRDDSARHDLRLRRRWRHRGARRRGASPRRKILISTQVLNSQDAVDAFASTAQMSLGTEIGMAVGPFGRSAETAVTAGDGGASAVFSYAHSKGLFAGVTFYVEIKILRRVRAESSRHSPRHRRDACSTAWRCRFLTARPYQHGRIVAEK